MMTDENPAAVAMLSPQQVADKLENSGDVLILDVRNQHEWDAHHIPGATLMPMHTVNANLATLDPSKETIVVCEHGMRSLSVARFLVAQAQFENVGNMVGGMSAWQGPVETGTETDEY